jgi:hypothetical protein
MYNEWNCSGDDELCNGLCIAMAQYPYDYITAVTSPIRLSDVVYVELKNPENQDHVPISSLTQPAFFHIPLHAGYSQTSGHKVSLSRLLLLLKLYSNSLFIMIIFTMCALPWSRAV